MTFRFQEGDEVVLKDGGNHTSFLPTGSHGLVFCLYATDPPAYEVNFRNINGDQIGAVVYQEELASALEWYAPPVREAVGTA